MSEWTNEEMLQQAQLNFKVSYLASIAFIKHKGLSIEEFGTFSGEHFASGWDEVKGADAVDIARVAAFNPISLGGSLVSIEGDAKHATAVFDFPIAELAGEFGVSQDEFGKMIDFTYQAIFDYLGISFYSKHSGERWTYELSY